MSDSDEEPEDRRTEGVRIIGAQEAAEAAARPDVVRRRSDREKRYGDRPDQPESASDLPKITISTTEGEGPRAGDRLGPASVVHPEDDEEGVDPRWADEEADDEDRDRYGHARIVAGTDDAAADSFERAERDDGVDGPAGSRSWKEEQATDAATEASPPPGHRVDEAYAALRSSIVEQEESQADRPEVGEAPEHEVTEPSERGSDSDVFGEAAGFEDEGAFDEDDSFVLPHWTEPPTGQVPKVVIGDDAPDSDTLATYGSQPRWRDEGERDAVTDFDDLVDEGPRLGALGGPGGEGDYEDDFFEDDAYEDDVFVEDVGYDEPDDVLAGAPRRRGGPRRPRDEELLEESVTGDRDLFMAVAVGVGLVAVGILCFVIGAVATTVLATVVITIAAWEYFTAVRTRGYNPATLLGMTAVIGVTVAAYTSGLAAYPVVLGLTVLSGLLWFLWVAPGHGAVQNLGLTLLGVLWIGVLGSFATLFLGLGRVLQDANSLTSNPGIGVLIAAVIAAVSHDIGAYFIGRFLGRTPLSTASPNKTQEGLAGGILTSLAVTWLVVGVVGIDPLGSDLAETFVFALVCALVAPLGDLAESFVKRDLGIKDMGSVLPGHGGVLDRFDALLFVLPAAYFVTILFDIWSVTGS